MSLTVDNLNKDLEQWFLLKHPFYQQWNEGKLTIEDLSLYAREYYHHVAAFPRYISQIHTLCKDISARQVLLDNLIDEEKGEGNHPELWLRFLEGVQGDRAHNEEPQIDATKELVDGFFELTKTDYHTGLGALYSYERQTADVSESKMDGLTNNYAINDAKTLEFFDVHAKFDKFHTQALVKLIKDTNEVDFQKVRHGALSGAKLLWQFLDGMLDARCVTCSIN
ncbi:PqqC-like protein [Rickettsiales endosymbiont of Paramecium tredecaurelia]|uniref:CADD family putative folate metabolism protein n=1 Tax=Candidatus Sarmatiella mevalonica TaxID=2770581 RepID=UPI001922FE4F|nr:CADD family putative folate metabolism protein [Candidatus Sarmatiella mevalonica]MBL3284248.1 PqqC-like protein [Candidatus Sarmatiella mevalonica]